MSILEDIINFSIVSLMRVAYTFASSFSIEFHGIVGLSIFFITHAIYLIPVMSSIPPSSGYPLNDRTHPGYVFFTRNEGTAVWIAIKIHDATIQNINLYLYISYGTGRVFFFLNIASEISSYFSAV